MARPGGWSAEEALSAFPCGWTSLHFAGPCSSDSRESSKADLTVKAGHTRGPSRISLPTTGMPLCYLDTQLSVSMPLPTPMRLHTSSAPCHTGSSTDLGPPLTWLGVCQLGKQLPEHPRELVISGSLGFALQSFPEDLERRPGGFVVPHISAHPTHTCHCNCDFKSLGPEAASSSLCRAGEWPLGDIWRRGRCTLGSVLQGRRRRKGGLLPRWFTVFAQGTAVELSSVNRGGGSSQPGMKRGSAEGMSSTAHSLLGPFKDSWGHQGCQIVTPL